MEEFMKPQPHNKPRVALAMHRDSHVVSKMKPKIRIIHIIAPEIIKTDVENFRELVQRLTGKPAKGVEGKKKAAAVAVEAARENVKREIGEEEGRESWGEGSSSGGFLSGLEEEEIDFFHGFGECSLFPLLNVDVVGDGDDAWHVG